MEFLYELDYDSKTFRFVKLENDHIQVYIDDALRGSYTDSEMLQALLSKITELEIDNSGLYGQVQGLQKALHIHRIGRN